MLLSDAGECSAISFLMVDRRILSVCKCYFKSRGNSAVWRPQSSTNLHHGLAWRHVYHYYGQIPLYYASQTMTSVFTRFSWVRWENAVPMIGVLTYFCVALTRWNIPDLHFDPVQPPKDTMLQTFNWGFFYWGDIRCAYLISSNCHMSSWLSRWVYSMLASSVW